ncbi:MAG: lamin tail domain-containing protein [Bacteroidia bacterium]|nr:lamin tail domain-containing protein [Bacteroidia bacterium]
MKLLNLKKATFLYATILISLAANAQFKDNFSDGNFTSNPTWTGNTSSFVINGGKLQSNNSVVNSSYFISTKNEIAVHALWQWSINIQFNPSSVNYADVFIVSDSADPGKAKNGYYVRTGSTQDDICLYKLIQGVSVKIIDGVDGLLNKSSSDLKIKIYRTGNAKFELYYALKSGGSYVSLGSVLDSSVLTSSFFCVRIKQSTAGFFQKHYFDDFEAGQIKADTIRPVLDSVIVKSKNTIWVYFIETIDNISSYKNKNYRLSSGVFPDSIFIAGNIAGLHFSSDFVNGFNELIYIDSVADVSGNYMLPSTKKFRYVELSKPNEYDIILSEIMADPDPPVAGLNYEYIEIFNKSNKYIVLSGCRLSDNATVSDAMTGFIEPGEYKVFNALTLKGFPSLSNSGETIYLTNSEGKLLHFVEYNAEMHENGLKKQGGWSLEISDILNPCITKGNWHSSIDLSGGTPGKENSVMNNVTDKIPPFVVKYFIDSDSSIVMQFNEVLDSLRAFNSGYILDGLQCSLISLSRNRQEIRIKISDYYEDDSVYVLEISGLADCSGNLTGTINLLISRGTTPEKGYLIINEILFNPVTGGSDYLEVYNRSIKPVRLKDLQISNTDASGNIDQSFAISADNLILLPDNYLLICTDQNQICNQYSCKGTPLVLQISSLPSMPDDFGTLMLINSTGYVIDSVSYDHSWHLQSLSDENGVSLERIDFEGKSCEKNKWSSAASVAKYGTPGYLNSQYRTHTVSIDGGISLEKRTVSPDNDGYEDLLLIHYHLDKPGYTANLYIYNDNGALVARPLKSETLSGEGTLVWDGTDDNGNPASIGVYILRMEIFDSSGKVRNFKKSCVVAVKI